MGEAVAAVVADDRYIAEDAADLVLVGTTPLEVLPSVAAAIRPGAIRLHDGWEDNFFVKRHLKAGEPDRVFDEAHGVLELDLITHRHSGIPLENCGCVAEYDEWDDQLTLWSSTQIPHLVRTGLADALQMPENRIRVVAPDVGGGFGIKGHLFPEEIAACVLAKLTRRPVKWIEDRREHLLASIHAREHDHRLQVAYAADGTVHRPARAHLRRLRRLLRVPVDVDDGHRHGARHPARARTGSGTTSARRTASPPTSARSARTGACRGRRRASRSSGRWTRSRRSSASTRSTSGGAT